MSELNLVEKVIALEAVELFKTLTPDQLARIASIATEVSFARGKSVIEPGLPMDGLYVVLDGSVVLTRNGTELHVARQNEVLGAWALFDNDPMPVAAKTAESTRLLRISREDFYDLLSDNVEVTAAVFSTIVKRFRKMVEE